MVESTKIIAERQFNKAMVSLDCLKLVKLCKKLSDAINQEVKQLPNPRHKLITIVFISERKLQDMRIASRCLWDTRFDNCVTVEYSNKSLYAVANIYGIYSFLLFSFL